MSLAPILRSSETAPLDKFFWRRKSEHRMIYRKQLGDIPLVYGYVERLPVADPKPYRATAFPANSASETAMFADITEAMAWVQVMVRLS